MKKKPKYDEKSKQGSSAFINISIKQFYLRNYPTAMNKFYPLKNQQKLIKIDKNPIKSDLKRLIKIQISLQLMLH